jgi:hypothetical protein
MSPDALEAGYWHAYESFYRWRSILRGARAHDSLMDGFRHAAYATGWKKFEPLWDAVIRARRLAAMLPLLEGILSGFGARGNSGSSHSNREFELQNLRFEQTDPISRME